MSLDKQFDELQRLFAQKDLLTEPRRSSGNGFMEILLVKRKNMKIKFTKKKGTPFHTSILITEHSIMLLVMP